MSDYLLPRVKIEVSCLSMDEPVEMKEMRSFMSEVRPEAEDTVVSFRTVIPTRTFLEKIFLLHEEFQKVHPRSLRMSRHLYDIERIMDTRFGLEALGDRLLYDAIVRHRSVFNHIATVDYESHHPATISILPPESVLEEWREDYKAMVAHFAYADAQTLSFDELLERVRELTARIRRM